MKQLSIFMLTLLVSASAYAQRGTVRTSNDYSSSSRANAVTGYLGFGSSAVNIGGEFEAAINSDSGIGGYFMLLTEEETRGVSVRPQVIAFGGNAKVHYRPGDWDLYAAPGFGIAIVEQNNSDETTLGPSVRLGVLYSLTPTVMVGLEHQTFFNWFENSLSSNIEAASAAVRLNF